MNTGPLGLECLRIHPACEVTEAAKAVQKRPRVEGKKWARREILGSNRVANAKPHMTAGQAGFVSKKWWAMKDSNLTFSV